MSLKLYQESIPFTNKRVAQPISGNSTFSNPIVMSFAFDFTVCTNVLETVLYIQNSDANNYYRNVIVTLCKDDPLISSPTPIFGVMKTSVSLGAFLDLGGRFSVPATYSVEQPPTIPDAGIYVVNSYTNKTIPVSDYVDDTGTYITTDENITARFSYGYDELSSVEWEKKRSALFIPSIGNISQPDTSYIPIRLRMNWKKASSLFTIRDYYLDISYEKVENIGVPM